MTKTTSFNTPKKIAAVLLGVLLACSLLFAGLFAAPAAYAADVVSASGIFDTSGATLESDSQNEGNYTHLTYLVSDGGTVAFRRDMALKWFALSSAENSNKGEVHRFSTEFSFAELNFTSFTLTMETTEMSQSKEGKAVNTIVFMPNGTGALNVSVNGGTEQSLTYTAGDAILVAFTDDDTNGNFTVRVSNATQTGVAAVTGDFTNIGKNFADYASASSDTPITPLTYGAETEDGAGVLLTVRSLNEQSFELDDENRVTDNAAPVLVIDSEIKQFVLGTQFDFEMTALDVCDSSISSSDRTSYYKTNPAEGDVVFENGALKVSETTGEDDEAVTTDIYTEWESDRYFFEGDFEGNPRAISIGVSLTDDSDNTGWYLVEWYGDYAGNTGNTYGIPVVTPESDTEARPDAGFYTVNETTPGTPEEPVADRTASTYQDAVNAATKDADGNQIQVGTGAYFYLPSLKAYISDTTCGYTDMEFTIYYTVNNGSTSSNSGLSYDELSLELTEEGTYRFRVVPTNAAGRAAYGVFEVEGSSPVSYKYAEITSDNVWDALNLATFDFTVVYNGPSVEPSDSDDSGYVDVTFTFDDFDIIALSGYQTKYTLNRVVLFDDSGITSVAALEQAIADGQIAASQEEADSAADGTYLGYFVTVAEYDDTLEADEGDNAYEWNPGSSLSFVPQEIGYYTLTVEVASYPWSNANGTVTAQKSIYVSAESDTVPGETYWLQNNILSVVFLAVGAACLIAIIVLVLVRPKKKVKADGNDAAADAEPTEKKDVQSLKDRRKERKNKK